TAPGFLAEFVHFDKCHFEQTNKAPASVNALTPAAEARECNALQWRTFFHFVPSFTAGDPLCLCQECNALQWRTFFCLGQECNALQWRTFFCLGQECNALQWRTFFHLFHSRAHLLSLLSFFHSRALSTTLAHTGH